MTAPISSNFPTRLLPGGDVVDFLVSPDGSYAAYVADQDTDGVFELYAVVVDKTTGDNGP